MKHIKQSAVKILLFLPLLALACFATAYPPATATETRAAQETAQASPTKAPLCIVTAFEALNLRATPGTEAAVIAILKHGDQLTILPDPAQGIWIRVQSDGRAGWINSNYCKEKSHE